MSDDSLTPFLRALREEGDSSATDSARFTRARVMSSLHRTQRRRGLRVAFLLPIAAVLVGSTALAAAGGGVSESWRQVQVVLGLAPATSPSPLTRPAARGAGYARAARALAAPPARTVPAAAPPPAESPAAEPAPQPAKPMPHASVAAPAPSASAAPAASDPSHELYRTAHRLHFSGGDRAAALEAWDAYLRAAPNGRFAMEARYNRALCLVQLGRRSEARAALEPFAEGRFGGYRKSEAQSLLDAL